MDDDDSFEGMASIGPWLDPQAMRGARRVKSAERTLALFELFSLRQGPLTISEITRALDIPQPSVTMLVRNLRDLGYLMHNRKDRTFLPTIRIMLLGSWLHIRLSEELNLEILLDRLVHRFNLTALVGIQNSIYCQYVVAQHPNIENRLEVQSGMLRPITRTAIGRVLLSLKPDAEIEAILRRCNAEFDPEWRVKTGEFLEMIAEIRRVGFAKTGGDMTAGRAVIAVSIPGLNGMPVAIGVGGVIDDVAGKEGEILAALSEIRSGRFDGRI